MSVYGPLGKEEQTVTIEAGVHQLFIDDFLIAVKENVRRTFHQPVKHPDNPILVPEHPWEGSQVLLFGSVIYDEDDGVFKMWYLTVHSYGVEYACYATSADGRHWEKPSLGVIEELGARENNIVFSRQKRPYYSQMNSVIKDPGDPDPQRRYKMTYCICRRDEGAPTEGHRNYGTATSPDGIHWTARQDDAIISPENAADTSFFIHDPISGKYILWARTNYRVPGLEARRPKWPCVRAVSRADSDDFVNWSVPKILFLPDEYDPPDSEIYTTGVFPYEGMYIAMVQMFHARTHEGTLDIQLATSRDGWHFERLPGRPTFLECGGVGEWDRFNQSVAGQPVIRGDELWFYYAGRTIRHGPYNGKETGPKWGAIGLAKLRRDGFCSMDAGFDTGTLATVPLELPAGDIHLNVKSDFGSVGVEILGEDFQPVPGAVSAMVKADTCDAAVGFPDGFGLSSLKGKSVRLRFSLSNARLYSFWVE